LRLADLQRPEELPGANTRRARGHWMKPSELPKDTVAMVIEANRELTRLEMGSDAIREELLVAA